MRNELPRFDLTCPLPLADHATVQLAHGGGGRLMRSLIEGLFLPAFAGGPAATAPPHDSAVVEIGGARLAFTTDTFVVRPLFFPGGDIGKLAVYGTVNDLAMAGARPLYLSAGFILEEGLPMETLRRVVASMAAAAAEAGVRIVTGDTKVVDRGKGDGIFINTAGIGLVPPGDRHFAARGSRPATWCCSAATWAGTAWPSCRSARGWASRRRWRAIARRWPAWSRRCCRPAADLHCLRDLTRGGLAAALNEIALDAGVGIELDEAAIPVTEPVAGACEMLGLDPLYVANEGRLVAFVAAAAAERLLEIMRGHPAARRPALIGRVTAEHPGTVELRSRLGGSRIVDLLSGEQMPRIC